MDLLSVCAIAAVALLAGYLSGRNQDRIGRRVTALTVEFGPGDKLVLASDRDLSEAEYDRLRSAMATALERGSVRTIVLPRGMRVDAHLRQPAISA